MNELDFCTFYCGELTEEQEAVLGHIIKTGRFLGAARCISGMTYMPAYKGYPNGAWHVIDRCGYGQLSAIDGRKQYYIHYLDRMPTESDTNKHGDIIWLRSDSETLVRWYKGKPIDAEYWRALNV